MSALRTLLFAALMAGVCRSQEEDCSYERLLDHLNLINSNSSVLADVRPVNNWTTPTLVQIDLVMLGILEMDEKSQTFTSHVAYTMCWMNEFVTWKPSEFCGIDELTVRREKLWIPDIHIQEDTSDTGSVKTPLFLSLFPTGQMFMRTYQRLTVTCQLKLDLFPFDKQVCNISFSSMSSTGEMTLGTWSNGSVLTEYSDDFMVTQGEWELEHIELIVKDFGHNYRTTLVYMVHIRRKPLLYVINLIVPLFYFLVLDLASFFISGAKGEKLGFKVTILLSISVLLLILQDMLPSTEKNLPVIALYCLLVFILVGISLLEAMLVGFLLDLDAQCGKKARKQPEFNHRK
ncbi:hypothetical protein LDENG_00003730, partial [Lucifuga dentata]